MRVVLVPGLAPIDEDGGSGLEGGEVVGAEAHHPRERRRRQLAHHGEERAPVGEAQEEALEASEGAPVAQRHRRAQPGTSGVRAAREEGGVRALIPRQLQRQPPRAQPLLPREGAALAHDGRERRRGEKSRARAH